MRVLVCGGRDFDDIDFMVQHIMEFHEAVPITVLISGGAKGADTIAEFWADEMEIEKEIYPITDSDWNKYGRSAGPRRNEEMLNAEPDLVMAFPGGNGTAHMAKISLEVPWIEVWQSHYILFKKEDIDYGFLSNFAEGMSFVDNDGLVWDTSEHYYQAHKSPLEKERGRIQMAPSPSKAKEWGQEIIITKDWIEGRKIDVMRKALTYKFAPGTLSAERLIGTGHDYLVEWAPWGDTYWGWKNRTVRGENHLGKLLMEQRNNLSQMKT